MTHHLRKKLRPYIQKAMSSEVCSVFITVLTRLFHMLNDVC